MVYLTARYQLVQQIVASLPNRCVEKFGELLSFPRETVGILLFAFLDRVSIALLGRLNTRFPNSREIQAGWSKCRLNAFDVCEQGTDPREMLLLRDQAQAHV